MSKKKKVIRVKDLNNVLKNYTEKYCEIKKRYDAECERIDKIYNPNTDYFKELKEATLNKFNLEVEPVKKDYFDKTKAVLKEARQNIHSQLCSDISTEDLNALTLLQQLDRVDETTIKLYADKFKGNSIATQVVKKIATKNNVNIQIYDTEMALEHLEDLENRIDKFYDNYKGYYKNLECEMLLVSGLFEEVDTIYLAEPYQQYIDKLEGTNTQVKEAKKEKLEWQKQVEEAKAVAEKARLEAEIKARKEMIEQSIKDVDSRASEVENNNGLNI